MVMYNIGAPEIVVILVVVSIVGAVVYLRRRM